MQSTDRMIKIECTNRGRHASRPVAQLRWCINSAGAPPRPLQDDEHWFVEIVRGAYADHPQVAEWGNAKLHCVSCRRTPMLTVGDAYRLALAVRSGDTLVAYTDMSRDAAKFK